MTNVFETSLKKYQAGLGDRLTDFRRKMLPPVDYTTLQAIYIGLCSTIDPILLSRSQCPHRAVTATLISQTTYSDTVADDHVLTASIQIDDKHFHFFHAVNSWLNQGLNCKTEDGLPWQLGRRGMQWIEKPKIIDHIEDVDIACPKRTLGMNCTINHAEEVVLRHFIKTQPQQIAESPDDNILCCTWVPCPSCLSLITSRRQLFGNSRIISAYGAQGDIDDSTNAQKIRTMFDDENIGRFHGPYFMTPKNPGYGWYPGHAVLLRRALENRPHRPLFEPTMLNIAIMALTEVTTTP